MKDSTNLLIKLDKIYFDDYGSGVHSHFTQLCPNCAKIVAINYPDRLSEFGYGICGILGCNNESEHYFDFPDHIEFIDNQNIKETITENSFIEIRWYVSDVLELCDSLTIEQAWKVLKYAEDVYDANEGLSYTTIQAAINALYPEIKI